MQAALAPLTSTRATPVYTWWLVPDILFIILLASSLSFGLPSISPSAATTVSAPIMIIFSLFFASDAALTSAISVSKAFCFTSSFATARAFCFASSIVTWAGSLLVIISSQFETLISNSIPSIFKSSLLLGDCDASINLYIFFSFLANNLISGIF